MEKDRQSLERQIVREAAPLVTVLMSVYNGQRFLRKSIESILRQTWTDFEFLIVNDGSSDLTREIIVSYRDPRIRLVDNPGNIGLTKSLNRGLALATSPFIARQDHDDVSHPNRLETQVKFLQSNSAVALVGTQVRIIDEHGRVYHPPGWERALTHGAIRFQLMFDSAFIHGSVLFRRDLIWNELGGYDERFLTAEDFELWSRVAAKYAVRNLPQPLVDFRLRADSSAAQFGSDHLRLSSAVVSANLRRYLNLTDIAADWPYLISSLFVNHAPGIRFEWSELIDVANEIFGRFIECYPEEKANHEVRRILANKMGQIACRVAGYRRRAALAAFRRACCLNLKSGELFASRFFFRLLFGERAFERARRTIQLARQSRFFTPMH